MLGDRISEGRGDSGAVLGVTVIIENQAAFLEQFNMPPTESIMLSHKPHSKKRRHKKRQKEANHVTLSFWEQFIISAALSFLTVLQSQLKNPIELDALKVAIGFLQQLLAGTVGAAPAAK